MNYFDRLINDINREINGITRLINGIIQLIDGITRLIHGTAHPPRRPRGASRVLPTIIGQTPCVDGVIRRRGNRQPDLFQASVFTKCVSFGSVRVEVGCLGHPMPRIFGSY